MLGPTLPEPTRREARERPGEAPDQHCWDGSRGERGRARRTTGGRAKGGSLMFPKRAPGTLPWSQRSPRRGSSGAGGASPWLAPGRSPDGFDLGHACLP